MMKLVPALLCSLAVLGCVPPLEAAPGPVSSPPVMPEESEGVSTAYGLGSALIGGVNVASFLNNTGDHNRGISRAWGYTGVVGGVLGMTLGGLGLAEDRSHEENALAGVNLGLGAMAAVAGVLALRQPKREQPSQPAVVGRVHFGAGVIPGPQRALVVQLTF